MRNKLLLLLVMGTFAVPVVCQKEAEGILANARALTKSGDYAQAAAEMDKAIALEPNNTRYLFDQAQYYEMVKNAEGVLKNIDRAVKLEPDNENTIFEAVRRLMPHDCALGLNLLDAFIKAHPQNDKAYGYRFSVRQCMHDETGAFDDITKAIELSPKDPIYQADRANLVSRMGNPKLAEDLLKGMIQTSEARLAEAKERGPQEEIKRNLEMSLDQLSLVYERSGDKEHAIEALTRAVELAPNVYLHRRTQAYGRFGMYKEAIADIDQAIADDAANFARFKSISPNAERNMSLYMERGNIFYSAGEYQKALADYQECLKVDARNKTLYQKLIDRADQAIAKPN